MIFDIVKLMACNNSYFIGKKVLLYHTPAKYHDTTIHNCLKVLEIFSDKSAIADAVEVSFLVYFGVLSKCIFSILMRIF